MTSGDVTVPSEASAAKASTLKTTTHKDAEDVGGNIATGKKNPYLKASDWGWQIDPLACATP